MARSIDEINIENFQSLGTNAPIARYSFQLTVKWHADDGEARTHGPQTYTYPNDLAAMPLKVRRRFAEKMIMATARVALGIDTWEMYE